MFRLSGTPIIREEEINRLKNDQAGALVVFEGWVRNHNQGKQVSSLEYQVYEALAQKEGEKILHEAIHKFNLHHVLCTHRFGHLELGEAAVWIGATATHRDDAFKACRYVIDEIKHRLPIWKKEHYLTEKPEWVFCKDHHTHVHFHEEDYYQKQNKLLNQNLLKSSRVLVVGAGGLGCPALMGLSAAGVGHIDIVDFDTISISNIHRQQLYSPELVGEKKVVVAQNKLSALNPFIHVHGHDARLDASNIERFISKQDLVLDCTDNLETKFLLHDACMKFRVPLISASIYQYEGQIRTFVPGQTGCLRCTHSETPDDSKLGNCNDFGVVGAAVNVIGSMQAVQALEFLQHKKNTTSDDTLFFNVQNLSSFKIKNLKKKDCPCCRGQVAIEKNDFEINVADLNQLNALIIDVREQEDDFLKQYINSTRPVVVYCHRGIRSKRLVKEMRSLGHEKFYSLIGGATSLKNQEELCSV